MEFRTQVDIPKPGFQIEPREELLFVGSCFADSIGQRFVDNQFRAVVNPYGTMYNPASVLHTVERWLPLQLEGDGGRLPRIVFLTLGTNHVYRLKETGEIVDNRSFRRSSSASTSVPTTCSASSPCCAPVVLTSTSSSPSVPSAIASTAITVPSSPRPRCSSPSKK